MIRRLMRMLVPILVVGGIAAPILGTQVAAAATGTNATTTSVIDTNATIIYGAEKAPHEQFTATVTASTAAEPTGTVTMLTAGQTICATSNFLTGGATTLNWLASCSPDTDTVMPVGTDHVTARYSGDSTYAESSYSSLAVDVLQPSAKVDLTVMPPAAYYGSEGAVSLSATVSSTPAGAPTPTGTVSFYDTASPSIPLCVASLGATGVATCPSPLSATELAASLTPYEIYAVYSGDPIFPSASSVDQALVVTSPTASVSLDVTGSPVYFGHESSVGLAATVATADAGAPAPSGGNVTFWVEPHGSTNAKAICTGIGLGAGGIATCNGQLSDTQLAAGTYDVYAAYSGDSIYAPTTSALGTLVVKATAVDVSLSFSPASTTYGQETNETVTVTVTSKDGAPAPAGYVDVASGSKAVCTLGLSSAGSTSSTGSCSIPTDTWLPAGDDVLTASYHSSDGIYPDTTGAGTLTVDAAATSTTFQLSQTTVYYGNENNVGFSSTVTGVPGLGVPTGTVEFQNLKSGFVVCSAPLVKATGDSASATCNPNSTTLGVSVWNDLGAVYVPAAGNNYAASTSSPLTLTVEAAPPTVSIALSPNTGLTYSAETAESFTVTVTGTTGANAPPAGTVTVYAMGGTKTQLCATSTSPSGAITSTGTCSITSNTALDASSTAYQVYAAFAPAPNDVYGPSSSPTSDLMVGQAQTKVAASISPTSAAYGNETSVVFDATVTNVSDLGSPGTSGAPTGTVTVELSGGTVLCTTPSLVLSNGSTSRASCSPSDPTLLDAGTYSGLVAVYNPTTDGNFLGSNGPVSKSLDVFAEGTTTVVSPNPASATYGSENNVTLSATVTSAHGQTPTGNVTFVTGTTVLCPSVPLDASGVATCSPDATALWVGTYPVDANYSGVNDFAPSTGSTSLKVAQASTSTSLSLSSGTIPFGQELTGEAFTATVTAAGSAPPTGTVQIDTVDFHGTVTTICTTGPLTQVGASNVATASCSPDHNDSLDGGTYTTHSLYAYYGGATNFSSSSSQTATSTTPILTVTPAPTTVKVWTTDPPVNYGNETSVDLHVKVSSPEGYLAPFDGHVTLSASADGTHWTKVCFIDDVHFGYGECSIPSNTLLDQGYYTITASYTGDNDFAASTTPGMTTLTVDPGVTTTTLTVGKPVIVYGNEGGEIFSAPVTDTTGPVAPSGTVTFTAGTSTVCTATLPPSATNTSVAACSPTAEAIPPGSYYPDTPLVATYNPPANGDWSDSASATNLGAPLLLHVLQAKATVTVAASPASVNYGNEDTVSFDVGVTSPAGTPTGSVTLTGGGVTLCTVTLSGGTGSCSPSSAVALQAGNYTVTASYGGSTNVAPASGTTSLQVVDGTTDTQLSVNSPLTVGSEQDGNFVVNVLDTTGSADPTGTVTITLTGTATSSATTAPVLCTAKLVGGMATCHPSSSEFAMGSYTVTAVYDPGTSSFVTSVQNASLTIDPKPAVVVPSFSGSGSFSLFTPSPSIIQTAPTRASVATSASGSFASQLATSGQVGAVAFSTSASSPGLSVSPTGAITTTGTLPAGTYSVVGTDVDANGNTGMWSFQLVVTSPTTVVTPSVTTKVVMPPQIVVASHNLVVHGSKVSLFTAAKLTCSNADCKGTTWLSQRQNHVVKKNGKLTIVTKIVVLGKSTYTVAAGKTHKQRITLNATGRKVLGKAKRSLHPLRVVLHANVKGGHESARTVKVV